MNAALLIIDMQNGCRDFCRCQDEFDGAVEYINEAAALFRMKNLPVIIVQDVEVDGGPGNNGFEVVEAIKRMPSDLVIHKEYNNAFWKTGLESALKELDVGFVVVSGFAAEYCVLFSLNGALERGFKASLLQNGVAGVASDEIRRIQLLRPVMSLQAIEFFIGSGRQ